MQVLIVDDSRAMRMMVSLALADVPIVDEVLEASCVDDAINNILPFHPVDVILCDWELDGTSGLDFLKALRSAEWDIPFAAITSESAANVREVAVDAGAAFVVAKPISKEELSSAIAEFFSQGSAHGAPRRELPVGYKQALIMLLSDLFDQQTSVTVATGPPSRRSGRWSVYYVDERKVWVAALILDMGLAACLSAALTKRPLNIAQKWAEASTLPEDLLENLREIATILAQIFTSGDRYCLMSSLSEFAPGEALEDMSVIAHGAVTENFYVSIDGYGGGLCSLVVL